MNRFAEAVAIEIDDERDTGHLNGRDLRRDLHGDLQRPLLDHQQR
jgi:hypothetical protein